MFQSRTNTCEELRLSDCGKKVILVGWYDNMRKVSKNLAFLIIRDFYGETQIVLEDEKFLELIESINKESTILVEGEVRERSSKNILISTGEIEIKPIRIEVLGKCKYNALPFEIHQSHLAEENIRLKYRYLDMRNPAVKKKLLLRSSIVMELREKMHELNFVEITTPILTCSSPEGARDYLVPARNHPGKFYALPQAPQQFKQILMASGFDRYFQIAPCFRDEDARADRSPGEFYQMDMEMAFASQEDVFSIIENVLPPIFKKYGIYDVEVGKPFRRIPYEESMNIYGTDKPDLRIDLLVKDITKIVKKCDFSPFIDARVVKTIVVNDFEPTRKKIEEITNKVEVETGNKMYWFKVDSDGNYVGGISKYIQELKQELDMELNLQPECFVGIVSGEKRAAQKTAGVLRRILGTEAKEHFNENCYEFCWIVDFPMYEIGEESGKIEFCHNPFSMPQCDQSEFENIHPLHILAYQYDLVCNGVELSSGAVRNHNPELMIKVFDRVGLGENEVKEKFPAMYNAFCYGVPPHAGIAPGVDRMIMLLLGEESIREVIAFPMNKHAQDILMGAPSNVSQSQLDELSISIHNL